MTRRPISPKARLEVFTSAQGVCHICGGKIHAERGEAWDVEHVRPLAMGGTDVPDNMRPAHRACHSKKTQGDLSDIARAKRRQLRHLGIKKAKKLIAGSRGTPWKRRINGETVRRALNEQEQT